MKYIIVDIDGTVADSRHRSHHIALVPGKKLTRQDGIKGVLLEIDHHLMEETAFLVQWEGEGSPHWYPHTEVMPWGDVNFDAWDRDAMGDTLIEPTAMVLAGLRLAFGPAVKFLFLTARGEGGRPETEAWLKLHGLFKPESGDILIMREEGCMEKDVVLKPRLLRQFISEGHEILFAFDDRGLVTKAFRDMGVFVFHVADYD